MIDKLFTKKRGVALVATIDNPGQKIAIPVPEITLREVPDNPPKDKDHDYHRVCFDFFVDFDRDPNDWKCSGETFRNSSYKFY